MKDVKCIACVAGAWQAIEREGKGQNDRRRIGGRAEENGLQGRHCFLRFLCPPDERKNPDWSNFMNNPIRCSDWSVICHSRASVFPVSFIQHVNSRNRFELFVEEYATIFG